MITIICKCGFAVRGKSQKHAEANMEIHKKSRMHKEQMKTKFQTKLSNGKNSERRRE